MTSAEKYATAAYLVVLAVVLLYVVSTRSSSPASSARWPSSCSGEAARAETRKIVHGRSHDGEAPKDNPCARRTSHRRAHVCSRTQRGFGRRRESASGAPMSGPRPVFRSE